MLFALLVAVGPGLALWAVGALTRVFGARVRAGVHVVMIGSLAGIAVLVAFRQSDVARGGVVLALGVLAGAVVGVLYLRVAQVRLFLLYLSPLPLLAAALFLFGSDISGLVTGGDTEVVEGVESSRSVVMLVLDEFPTATILGDDGTIDADEFPNLARLSESSTWYRNYTTHNAGTIQAVPSLLSGQLPTRGHAPLYTDWPENLFTLLGGSYDMAVQESVTQLCPPDVCEDSARTVTRSVLNDREGFPGATGDAVDVFRQLISLNADARVEVDQFTEEVVSVRGGRRAHRRRPRRRHQPAVAVHRVPGGHGPGRGPDVPLRPRDPPPRPLALLPRRHRVRVARRRSRGPDRRHVDPQLADRADQAAARAPDPVHRRAGRADGRPAPGHRALAGRPGRRRGRPRRGLRGGLAGPGGVGHQRPRGDVDPAVHPLARACPTASTTPTSRRPTCCRRWPTCSRSTSPTTWWGPRR